MNKEDLTDLLIFAKDKGLMQAPVLYVYSLYFKDLQDKLEVRKVATELFLQDIRKIF